MKTIIRDHSAEVIAVKNSAVKQALEDIGLIAEGYAKAHIEQTPRRIDTGRLRNSITHQVGGGGAFEHKYSDKHGNEFVDTFGASKGSVLSVAVGTAVEYGKYVELGTENMEPNNFLRSATGDHLPEYRSIIIEALKR